MLLPVGQNLSLYNLSAGIERNPVLNRALMESIGVEVPFSLMANNKDEVIERFIRGAIFVFASFIAPVVTMPLINKFVLKKSGIIENEAEAIILRVSKKYLSKDTELLKKGFEKTAEELEKNPKFKDASAHFEKVWNSFSNKEELREKLIKVHKKIFSTDFAISSLLFVSIPWLGNYITEKRTGRIGYVGEFKMADKKYTDKMAESHQKTRRYKIALSTVLAMIPALIIPKLASKAMLKPVKNPIMKFFKNTAHIFDYTDSVFLSKSALFAIMLFGDLPTYMLACRDKHELKYRTEAALYMIGMLFGGEPVLNNIFGRLCDKIKGTTIMNREGSEDSSLWKDFKLHPHKLEKLKTMPEASQLTKKLALGMYWGNFVLTTALIGIGMPFVMNKKLRKDVKANQKNLLINASNNNLKMNDFIKQIQTDADKTLLKLSK